jgi:hypothetical protein
LELSLHRAPAGPKYTPKVFSAKRNFNFDGDTFHRSDPVPHWIKHLFTDGTACEAHFRVRRPAKEAAHDLIRVSPANPLMNYTGFWGLLNFVLVEQRAVFLHAGSYATRDGAVALIGTGGSGKTSLLFTLLEYAGHAYLAEDFTVLGSDGTVFYNPKHVSVYGSDTRQPILARHVSKLPTRSRLVWSVRRMFENPRAKVSPRNVLEGRVGTHAPLARAIYLVRTADRSVRVEPLELDDLVRRALHVALRELKLWFESFHLVAANQAPGGYFPVPDTITRWMADVYRSAFAKAERLLVHVPLETGPRQLIEQLAAQGVAL